jgi:endonuclease/exonuclease/phosphatase family metal-dependent hydrolase
MKILAWNVNHRARPKAIPPGLGEAIGAMAPDLVVLTEYVPSDSHAGFLSALGTFGLLHTCISGAAPKENRVLIASRWPLEDGDIHTPPIAPSVPSNALHVYVPDREVALLGIRIPDYSKEPALRRRCWDWLLDTARTMAARPFIIVGDLNTDPKYPRARCGDRIGQLIDAGFIHASPAIGASYWTLRGLGVRIDHAFTTKSFNVLGAEYVTQVGQHVLVGSRAAYSDHAALLVDVTMRPSARPSGGSLPQK